MVKAAKNLTVKAPKKRQDAGISVRTDVSDWLLGILSEEYGFPASRISLNSSLDDWGYGSKERLASLAGQFNRFSANVARFNFAKISPPDLIQSVHGKTLVDIIIFLESVAVAAGRALYVPIGQELTDVMSPHVLALADPRTSLRDQVKAWIHCYLAGKGWLHVDLAKILFGRVAACAILVQQFNAYAEEHWNGATADAGDLGHVTSKTLKGLIDYLFGTIESKAEG
jgi:hypothetical protein